MKAPITLKVGNMQMDRHLGLAIQPSHLLFTTILQELYLEASFTEMKLWHSRHAAGVFFPHFTRPFAPFYTQFCTWEHVELGGG